MTRRVLRFIVCIIVAQATSACVMSKYASGPAFAPTTAPPGKARVYFFRERMMRSSAVGVFMSIPTSANNCFEMASGGYYAYEADPGHLDVTAVAGGIGGTSRTPFGIDLKPGETRYVQIELHGGPHLNEVSEGEAQKFLGDTKQIAVCSK